MNKGKVVTVVAITTVVLNLMVLTTPVLAWHFNGWYWEAGPVDLYFLVEDDVDVLSWVGWYCAHLQWNEAENSPTEFIYTENPSIDVITCEYGYSSSSWVGKTWFNPIWPGVINYAGVMMNEYYTNDYEFYKRVAVGAHEFGHTLGLAHNDGEHLMETWLDVFYGDYGIYYPTATDINEVNARY